MVFSLNIRFYTESWPEWDSSRAHDLVLTVHMIYPLLLLFIYIYIYIYIYVYIYIYIYDIYIYIYIYIYILSIIYRLIT